MWQPHAWSLTLTIVKLLACNAAMMTVQSGSQRVQRIAPITRHELKESTWAHHEKCACCCTNNNLAVSDNTAWLIVVLPHDSVETQNAFWFGQKQKCCVAWAQLMRQHSIHAWLHSNNMTNNLEPLGRSNFEKIALWLAGEEQHN
jgi:hypothetical protein